jgi:hypothetical protein
VGVAGADPGQCRPAVQPLAPGVRQPQAGLPVAHRRARLHRDPARGVDDVDQPAEVDDGHVVDADADVPAEAVDHGLRSVRESQPEAVPLGAGADVEVPRHGQQLGLVALTAAQHEHDVGPLTVGLVAVAVLGAVGLGQPLARVRAEQQVCRAGPVPGRGDLDRRHPLQDHGCVREHGQDHDGHGRRERPDDPPPRPTPEPGRGWGHARQCGARCGLTGAGAQVRP